MPSKYAPLKTIALLALSAPLSGVVQAQDSTPKLIENAQYQLESHLDTFTDSPAGRTDREIDDAYVVNFTRLNIETNTDVTDSTMFDMSIDLLASLPNTNNGVFAKPDNRKTYSRFLDINTAYFTIEQDSSDIQIGKLTYETGYSEIYSVIDRWNLTNVNNPIHKVKAGRWQVRGTYYLDEVMDQEDSLTVAVMPFDDRAGSVDNDSRWLGASSDGDFFSATSNLTPSYRSNEPHNWSVIVEYKGTREGYDFTLGASRGASSHPVIRSAFNTTVFPIVRTDYKEYITTHNVYGGISITDDNFLYYGEFFMQDALHGKDDDVLHAVAGLTYKETDWASRIGLDEISPTIEYSREKIFNEQIHTQYTSSSEDARPFKNTLSVDLKLVYNSDYTLRLGTKRNIRSNDFLNNLNFEYKHNDNNYFYLNGYMFGGKSDTQFGRWGENDVISVGYLRKF